MPKNIHLIIPFSRLELKEKLIEVYRPMGVLLHPIMFQDEEAEFNEPWIFPFIIPMVSSDCKAMMPGTFKRNSWILNNPIVLNDYYLNADDDDFFDVGVFDAIREMDDDIVVISMKRGYRIPGGTPPLRQYPTWPLLADPEFLKIGIISAQQFFVKGKIYKDHPHNEESHNWDGELIVHYKETGEEIAYRPDLYALFNYFEPGRWDKPRASKFKVSNFHLAIGVPCSFPSVPLDFFRSFTLMEKPDYELIVKTNGPIDTLRNDIVQKALEIGATNLITLDVDMVYHPLTIPRLLSHKLPIVGALCFRRYPPFDSIMLKKQDDGFLSLDEWEEEELVEVDATGAGCLMFDMSVFRKMPYPWFKFRKDADSGANIGEDVGFCADLKEAGYRIFVDTSVPAGHLTTMVVNRQTYLLYKSMKVAQQRKNAALGFPDKEINI